MAFRDRLHAGQVLASVLAPYRERNDLVVLGLPRGGVPVAEPVAEALGAPLDILIVRKLGVPGYDELAMGAIASGGIRVLNDGVLEHLGITDDVVERVARTEQHELERREQVYRGDRPPVPLEGKTVIVIDDGLATGASMRAALQAARARGAARVVAAVPIGAPESCEAMAEFADDVVCAVTPQPFGGVGRWYQDFSQTSDQDVREALARAGATMTAVSPP